MTLETMLTCRMLKEMKPGIFDNGFFIDDSHDVNMAGTGKVVPWVAVRGDIDDWAIYSQNPHYVHSTDPDVIAIYGFGDWPLSRIADYGDKIHNMDSVMKLVPFDEEAGKKYRH